MPSRFALFKFVDLRSRDLKVHNSSAIALVVDGIVLRAVVAAGPSGGGHLESVDLTSFIRSALNGFGRCLKDSDFSSAAPRKTFESTTVPFGVRPTEGRTAEIPRSLRMERPVYKSLSTRSCSEVGFL
ncbi:hypothetical protein D3C84_992650 [compost metagenome]